MNKLIRLITPTVIIASLFIFSSQALAVQYFTVSTSSGAPVNMRSGPGTNYPIMLSIPSGTRVPYYCYAYGTTVTGKYGTSNIWDQVQWKDSRGVVIGYVSDTYVYTGSGGPVGYRCN
ncbi:SH3 domain-containing protein [Bacillus cabrialesii]|uniref:SH3 domain-containing protein n=1 Tax=Bacillus cabrialesii TaxID=2487276 RepID=UPI000CDA9153|nr:SH3 domain-containing protein [Bacillus cabrialesii]AUZ27218.1 SH3 domain-containing protein [Bacillus cereus]MBU2658310.1 SH3 domain-containing protein [Bacillus cabrialesii]POO75682.1 SH3 domain-containing protein [Bacillus subtilis]